MACSGSRKRVHSKTIDSHSQQQLEAVGRVRTLKVKWSVQIVVSACVCRCTVASSCQSHVAPVTLDTCVVESKHSLCVMQARGEETRCDDHVKFCCQNAAVSALPTAVTDVSG